MVKLLELLGIRRPSEGRVVPLFSSWHVIAVLAGAAVVIALIHRLA